MDFLTDLACEASRLDPDLEGVKEERLKDGANEITRTEILSEAAAKRLKKRMGTYVTIDLPFILSSPRSEMENLAKTTAGELKKLIASLGDPHSFLIVGLGNREVTPDSLGPITAGRVFVTRHVIENLPDALYVGAPCISAVSPGVLGTTGIETSDYIKSLTDCFAPDVVIAVDALASLRAERIGSSVQLTDAGIAPGSGVGNIRSGLNSDALGVPVIAIGVPLVVHARTIVSDAVQKMASLAGLTEGASSLLNLCDRVMERSMDEMIMTPKDVDSIVDTMGSLIADSINMALFGESYESAAELFE